MFLYFRTQKAAFLAFENIASRVIEKFQLNTENQIHSCIKNMENFIFNMDNHLIGDKA